MSDVAVEFDAAFLRQQADRVKSEAYAVLDNGFIEPYRGTAMIVALMDNLEGDSLLTIVEEEVRASFNEDLVFSKEFWETSRYIDQVSHDLSSDIPYRTLATELPSAFTSSWIIAEIVDDALLKRAKTVNPDAVIEKSGRFIFPLDANDASHREFIVSFFEARVRTIYGDGGPVDNHVALSSPRMRSGINVSSDVFIRESNRSDSSGKISVDVGFYDLLVTKDGVQNVLLSRIAFSELDTTLKTVDSLVKELRA